jgi:PPOX class probable F420-dependent enzyme
MPPGYHRRMAATFSPAVLSFMTRAVRYATLASVDPDGAPHQAVIWYLLRDERLLVNSRIGRRWPRNLQRDPRCSLAIEAGDDAVSIAALAEVIAHGRQAQDDIVEMARRYYDPELAEREIARFRTEQRITFMLHPQRVHVHGAPG